MKINKKIILLGVAALLVLAIAIIILVITNKSTEPDNTKKQTYIDNTGQPTGSSKTSPTTTGQPTNAEQGNADESFSEPVPTDTDKLIAITPHYTEHFSVEFDSKDQSFIVTLYAILNHAWQLEQYQIQLKQYKQEALAWIAQQGVDPAGIKINYIPEEANNL